MTLHVEVNPPGADEAYLASLNACFGHWGGRAMFDWVFTRTAGSYPADRLLVRDDRGELLAGSGVSYRRVHGAGRAFEAGIMTGSWTLPAARGRGCFTRIIEESRRQAARRGCTLLLAFVTGDNASRRRLEEAGARMLPSRYVFTDHAAPRPAASLDVEPLRASDEALWRSSEASRGAAYHFTYPHVSDFVGQCIARPNPVGRLRVGRAEVLVERAGSTDRISVANLAGESLQDVFGTVAARAHDAGRQFFAFTMGAPAFEGLVAKEGFLTLLPAAHDGARDAFESWHIDSGDRM